MTHGSDVEKVIATSRLIVRCQDRRFARVKEVGWVYAARNEAYGTDVLKIGQTRVSPMERVVAMSRSTEVLKPFELVYFLHASNRLWAERTVHDLLAQYRVRPNKEFFRVDLLTAGRVLEQVAHNPIYSLEAPAIPSRQAQCSACGYSAQIPNLLVPLQLRCLRCQHIMTLQFQAYAQAGSIPG
ncbi:MAG: GIY-YIG nuclease family protein [Bacteroidota bacterium]|nr:GIY-YIG nuclease family protein [Bacteroidota bacterium]MDE2957427.1 GIY-YIG nuclease family protein [Bacteroidota bacterium]